MSIANFSTHTHTRKKNGKIYVSRANIADFVKGYLRKQSSIKALVSHWLKSLHLPYIIYVKKK